MPHNGQSPYFWMPRCRHCGDAFRVVKTNGSLVAEVVLCHRCDSVPFCSEECSRHAAIWHDSHCQIMSSKQPVCGLHTCRLPLPWNPVPCERCHKQQYCSLQCRIGDLFHVERLCMNGLEDSRRDPMLIDFSRGDSFLIGNYFQSHPDDIWMQSVPNLDPWVPRVLNRYKIEYHMIRYLVFAFVRNEFEIARKLICGGMRRCSIRGYLY